MTAATARMAVLNFRTVAPYKLQHIGLFLLVVALFARRPAEVLPALIVFVTTPLGYYPFVVADKARLETLYNVLPIPRRSVLYGHYVWALVCYAAVASTGTVVALLCAWVEARPLTGREFGFEMTASWVVFAVMIAVQYPMFIRFGYVRFGAAGTMLPLSVILVGTVRLHPERWPIEAWLPLGWMAGAALIAASVWVALSLDRRGSARLAG